MRTIAIIMVLLIVATIPALAVTASITQTKTFSGTPSYNPTFTFDKFNSSLGKLDSIIVTFTMGISGGYLTADNDGAEPATVTVKLGANGLLSSTDVPLLNSSFQPVVPSISLWSTDTFDLAKEDGDGVGNVDASLSDGDTLIGGAASDSKNGSIADSLFANYIGAGTYNINGDFNQILDFGGVGGVEGAFSSVTTNGTLQIVYNYTPVPEPSSMIAMLAGLSSLAGLAARRRK